MEYAKIHLSTIFKAHDYDHLVIQEENWEKVL